MRNAAARRRRHDGPRDLFNGHRNHILKPPLYDNPRWHDDYIVAIILSIIIINRLELVIEFQYNVPVARNVIGIILEIDIFFWKSPIVTDTKASIGDWDFQYNVGRSLDS